MKAQALEAARAVLALRHDWNFPLITEVVDVTPSAINYQHPDDLIPVRIFALHFTCITEAGARITCASDNADEIVPIWAALTEAES